MYEFFERKNTSWEEAKNICESLGGYLVTITSKEEHEYVYDTLGYSANAKGKIVFLGATDDQIEGTWNWITGEDNTYMPMCPGEPNGGVNENYLVFWPGYTGRYCFDDMWEVKDERTSFICEWDDNPYGSTGVGHNNYSELDNFFFHSFDSGIVRSNKVLEKGYTYLVVIKGNFSYWSAWEWDSGWEGFLKEETPIFPSEGRTNSYAAVDVCFVYACPSMRYCNINDFPRKIHNFKISLDGGITWNNLSDNCSVFDTNHRYEFTLKGQGSPFMIKMLDTPNSDNYGDLSISIYLLDSDNNSFQDNSYNTIYSNGFEDGKQWCREHVIDCGINNYNSCSDERDSSNQELAGIRIGLSSLFSYSDEGWHYAGDGVVVWQDSGGNSGGYLQGEDEAKGGIWYFVSPTSWGGDWTDYINGTLSFDLKIIDSFNNQLASDDVDTIRIYGKNGKVLTWSVSTVPNSKEWTHYEVFLNHNTFNVDEDTFLSVLSNVKELWIRGEFISGGDMEGLDNVKLSVHKDCTLEAGCSNEELSDAKDEGYSQGYADGLASVNCSSVIDAGIEQGRQQCIENPDSCGIETSCSTLELSSARQQGRQECINNPSSCGLAECTSEQYLSATSYCGSYDFITNTLHIPCVEAADSTYWLDFSYTGNGLLFDIVDYGTVFSPEQCSSLSTREECESHLDVCKIEPILGPFGIETGIQCLPK